MKENRVLWLCAAFVALCLLVASCAAPTATPTWIMTRTPTPTLTATPTATATATATATTVPIAALCAALQARGVPEAVADNTHDVATIVTDLRAWVLTLTP